jgi:GTP cyclohydrolase I
MDKFKIIENAQKAYGDFLTALEFNWENDPNMKDTPRRVAKMMVNEIYSGVYDEMPNITAFDNIDEYDGMVFQGNITLQSTCSHHVLPFIGHAHVAYIPGKKIIGLSKLNRIVEYYARRPQVQENLTKQIHDAVNKLTEGNGGVAVMIEAKHLCACVRGVRHSDSIMKTSKLSGAFMNESTVREEFYSFVNNMPRT